MPKQVLIISGSYPPYPCGVGIYTDRLLNSLAHNPEVKLHLLTSTPPKKVPKSVTIHRATSGWGALQVTRLIREIKNIQPDIIHIQYPTRVYGRHIGINLLPLLLWLNRKSPVITLHEYSGSSLAGKARNLLTLVGARHVLVSNIGDLHALPALFRRRASLVPIGSNIPSTQPNKKRAAFLLEKSGLNPDKPFAFFFGFPFPSKQLELAINAASLADIQLLIASPINPTNNAYEKKLHDSIESTKQVGLLSNVSDTDIDILLFAARYFILPQSSPPLTAKSGTSIAAAEHGLVIVAADGGSDSRPFRHKVNSYLLDAVTPESIAAALTELEEDPELRTSMGSKARQLADDFSWDAIAAEHIKLYETL